MLEVINENVFAGESKYSDWHYTNMLIACSNVDSAKAIYALGGEFISVHAPGVIKYMREFCDILPVKTPSGKVTAYIINNHKTEKSHTLQADWS